MSLAVAPSSYQIAKRREKVELARLAREYRSETKPTLARAATAPINFNFPTSTTFPGGIDSAQPSAAVLLRECRGIAAAAQRAISNRLSTLELEAKVSTTVRGEETLETLPPGHPLSVILKRPHKNFSQSQFLRLKGDWMGSVGEAYDLKIDNGLNVPTQLQPMNPKNVVPVVQGGEVASYVITDGSGAPRSHPADVVIRCYFPDPESPHAAEGLLAPVGIEVDSLKFSGEHHRAHFQNDATPKSVMKAKEGANAWSVDEKKAFYETWVQANHQRLGKRIGLPAFLPLNWDLMEIASQSGADIVPLLQYWRDTVLMGYGVPKSILGLVESGDRSSAETNQYVFDRHVIVPFAKVITDALTWQLAIDFDPKLVVTFKKFVSADKEFELKERESKLKTKQISINMAHDEDGTDPVPWGDDPVATFAEIPYLPEERFDLEDDDADVERSRTREEPDAPEREITPIMRATWARQINVERTFIPWFRRELRKVFKLQRDDTIANLEATEERARIGVEEIFDPDEWVDEHRKTTEVVRRQIFTDVTSETLEQLTDTEFVFSQSMEKALRQQGGRMIKDIGATTQDKIARQLRLGTAEGESISQLSKRINKVFRDRSTKQANVIARTEVLKASQSSQLEAYDQSGVVEKLQWNTSLDDAVRDSHVTAEGQIIERGDSFILGDGEAADAPGIGEGGGQLSAGNTINCRCFTTPVIE